MIVGASGQEGNTRNSTEMILIFYLQVLQVLFIRKSSQGGTHRLFEIPSLEN